MRQFSNSLSYRSILVHTRVLPGPVRVLYHTWCSVAELHRKVPNVVYSVLRSRSLYTVCILSIITRTRVESTRSTIVLHSSIIKICGCLGMPPLGTFWLDRPSQTEGIHLHLRHRLLTNDDISLQVQSGENRRVICHCIPTRGREI